MAVFHTHFLHCDLVHNGNAAPQDCTTCISHTTSYHFIWKNFLQASSNMWLQYGSVPPHVIGHRVLESVLWMPLNWSWGLTYVATRLTALDLLWLLYFDVAWRSWCIRRRRRQGMSSCGASCTGSLLHKTIMTTYRKQHVLLLNELACA